MKSLVHTIAVFCFILAAGCAPVPSYDDLEAQAEATGDWSLVERYERMMARRELTRGPSCPNGKILYCENMVSGERCACTSSDALRAFSSLR